MFATFSDVVGSVSENTSVTLTVTAGGVSRSGTITVVPPTIFSLLLDPSKLIGGQDTQGRLRLTADAPPGGTLVQLASANTSKVLVAPSILVPAGQREVTFPIATFGLEQTTLVEVSATRGSQRVARTLELAPEGPTAIVVPATILGGMPAQGRLDALLSTDDFVVSLSSDKPALATVTPSVAFRAGETSKPITVQTTPVSADATVTITAMLVEKTRSTTTSSLVQQFNVVQPTFKRTTTFVVKPPAVTVLEFANASIVGPGSTTATVRLNGPAPSGGLPVSITSDQLSIATAGSVIVPAGANSVTFPVNSARVNTTTTVYFTARTGTTTRVAGLQVRAQ
jgi:hypothetical protein